MNLDTASILEEYSIEPIALIGIGCRFPGGAHDTDSFWDLLKQGSDAIVEAPPERWNLRRFYDPNPNKPGKMYTRHGGFLRQRVDEFDAAFFGIAPREAECMDPQQRLLLETSWEALEDAGIPHEALAGSNTGVFIGAFTLDHKLTQMGKMNRDAIGTHTAIGSTMTILSNRISYTLDLRGPSMSLDTACSSSLVALHLACQAIWRGECDLAMAGGVNVMMRPEYPIAMCKGGFLAPDGRSKSFDAAANGYGRGEGAGVVVLKPLSAALRDGDSIYALVRGTGANQDGRTNGITVPNPESQTALAREVCARYRIDTRDIHYFEAHGTGTPVGDPLEARALGSVLGQDRDEPCLVGSVKAAIGHLEAAAGVAGVIKTSLCLSHRQVPPQANLNEPNPNIPFAELGLRLPRQLEPLAPGRNRACAGVNSFGYGGTNAHAILESPPRINATVRDEQAVGSIHLVPLSARSEAALAALAQAWLQRFTEDQAPPLHDLAYSAACRRGHHPYRLAVAADSVAALREQLQLFVEQGAGAWLAAGKVVGEASAKPVFVYTGMGPQWWAMGRELYASEPVYRQAVEECDALFQRLAGWSILQEMLADEDQSRITATEVAQPANFLIQVGLTALWRSLGIEPAAIVGHSVGEVSAAYAAGVLSLEDAVKVSYQRSRIQKKAAGLGKMLAVGLGLDQCRDLLELTDGRVSIAAINSPSAVTLAGEAQSLEAIAEYLTQTGEFNRFLQVEVAYHSPFMEALKPEVREVLADLQPRLPSTPLYSTVTGDRVDALTYDAEYWCNNIREPVYFAKAMASLLRDGHRIFLEVGPHPVLSSSIKECCRQQNIQAQTVASLRRERPERRTLHLALAGLYTAGCVLDWGRLYPHDSRYVKLPTYPWQRETHWREVEDSLSDRIGTPTHPLLDRRLPDPRPSWQGSLNRQMLPYLDDHQVDGLVILPGAAYIEAALAASTEVYGDGACVLNNLTLHQALVIDDSTAEPVVHVNLDAGNGEYTFFSRDADDVLNWRLHASATCERAPDSVLPDVDRQAIVARCRENVNVPALYAHLGRRGLLYGPRFQTLRQLWRCEGEVLARIALHEALIDDAAAYRLHPSLLDGCFQSLIATLEDDEHFYMPVSIRRIVYRRAPGTGLWCHGKLTRSDEQGIEGDLTLFDDEGQVAVQVQGLRCRALATQREDVGAQLAQWAYGWNWVPQSLQPTGPRMGTWLVFTDFQGVGESLCRELEAHSANRVIRIPAHEIYQREPDRLRPLDADECAHLQDVLRQAQAADCVGVVYLWGLDARIDEQDPTGIAQTGTALQIMQMLGATFVGRAPRCYLLTQGAQPVNETDRLTTLAQAPLVGLARVAFNEYPAFRTTLVDLDPDHSPKQLDLLRLELLGDDGEDDVAFRGGERYVHRLERLTGVAQPSPAESETMLCGSDVQAFALKKESRPQFRELTFTELKPDRVEIEVQAVNLTGVSVSDGESRRPGYFASGVVRRIGEEVRKRRVGDAVLVVAEGLPVSHVISDARHVFSIDGIQAHTPETTAAWAGTLVPAYHALRHIARIAPGELVLIDADAGAIALAAQSVAASLGARPYLYTVEAPRLLALQALSGSSVIDARQADWADRLQAEGTKMQARAWLHAGAGERIDEVAALLAPDAHEIVLTQNGANQRSMAARRGSYSHVDALTLALDTPELFGRLWAELGEIAKRGAVTATAVRPIAAEEALERLAAGDGDDPAHTLVLSFQDKTRVPVAPSRSAQALFDAEASYLITGGFGGFGLEAAHWMAKRGARHLVLVSRRGAADPAALAAVQALEASGARVMAAATDIADADQVKRLLARVDAEFPPLKGILHAAAVLDDAPMAELSPQRVATVMLPKALGAWHLHTHTRDRHLDFFMLFSSVSALIGNARQANYAAANTFLDALAWHRKTLGLPAASINWGAIATGMAVDSEEVKKHLELMGMSPLTAVQALEAWAAMMGSALPQYGLLDANWSRWQEFEPTGGNSPRFSQLVAASGAGQDSMLTAVCQLISQMPEEEREAAMGAALAEQVAKTLRLPAGKVDLQQSLSQMGVDSLMAAELQTAIYQTFGVRVSTLELMRGQSLAQLVGLLMEKTSLATGAGTPTVDDDPPASVVDRLSGEDVDILLSQLLTEEDK